jgi:hypothetical protein
VGRLQFSEEKLRVCDCPGDWFRCDGSVILRLWLPGLALGGRAAAARNEAGSAVRAFILASGLKFAQAGAPGKKEFPFSNK